MREKAITSKNLVMYANEAPNKKSNRKKREDAIFKARVKCYCCQSEGCSVCNFTGLIEIR